MKKQHDVTMLTNELAGSSAYFQEPQAPTRDSSPSAPGPALSNEEHPPQQLPAAPDRSDDRSVERPAARAVQKRQTQRRAFEFYRDQVETFKGWLAVEIAEGGEENMSIWAREAFDAYIARRNVIDRQVERPIDRPTDRPAESREE